jgi:hypothetical protein
MNAALGLSPSLFERGAHQSFDSLTFIPARTILKPLRDWLAIEPLDVVFSRILIVPKGKPVRGVCRAAGPGVYPLTYDHADKGKRTMVYDRGTIFRPTATRVGDTLWFGGLERDYHFQQFWHGDRAMVLARDEDVVCIEDP